MTSFGIVKFVSQREKIRFKKWLGSLEEPPKRHGKKLRIGENEEKEERDKGRAIAKVVRCIRKQGEETGPHPGLLQP